MNAYCIERYMKHSFRAAKKGTARQSDKQHEHSWNTTKKEGTKKGLLQLIVFTPGLYFSSKQRENTDVQKWDINTTSLEEMTGSTDQLQ